MAGQYCSDRIAEEYLNQIPTWASEKNSLTDIRCFLAEMGNPDKSMKIIHVAGTNGKGSVCAYLTSVFMSAGYHVGTFTSPHLVEIRERFELDGKMVDKQIFTKSFNAVKALAEKMVKRGFHHPTYFEFLFYMGIEIFAAAAPDFVVLETGLGGRLDTTNVIDSPLLSIITSISLDHMEYLGDTVAEIAGEKAGIIKDRVPVVYDSGDAQASAVIVARAVKMKAPAYPVGQADYSILSCGSDQITAEIMRCDRKKIKVTIGSAAEYQVINAAVAARGIEVLDSSGHCQIGIEALRAGIENMRWAGRMEQICPGVYLDGAHNAAGIRAFTKTAVRIKKETGKKVWLLFAAVSDKEFKTMIQTVCEELKPECVVVARLHTKRTVDAEILSEEFEAMHCKVAAFETAEEAVEYALASKASEDLLYCVGSLYLIGELEKVFRRKNDD